MLMFQIHEKASLETQARPGGLEQAIRRKILDRQNNHGVTRGIII